MKKLIETIRILFSSENDFFVLAKNGKRITHIAIAIPLLIVFFIVGFIFSEFVLYQIILQRPKFTEVFNEFYTLVVSFGFVMFLLWLWVHFFEKRSFRTLGLTKGRAFFKYITGFLLGFIMLSIVIGLMAVFGTIGFKEDTDPFSIDFLGIMILLLIGYVIQGATEELIARGWQFQVIGARYRPWLGALISSLIFALIHGLNTGISVLAIINLLLFALMLIIFILYNHSIWAACGWHTAWNWAMENIYGLKVSGSEGFGSLLNLTAEGPKYITGGEFGPEGSILTTFVLIAGMLTVIILKSKEKN